MGLGLEVIDDAAMTAAARDPAAMTAAAKVDPTVTPLPWGAVYATVGDARRRRRRFGLK